MVHHLRRLTCFIVLGACLGAADDAALRVPNPSFEQGAGAQPEGWILEGAGRWLDGGAAEGRRAIAASGDGTGNSHWRSAPLALRPDALYQLSFRARGDGASGGTPTSGTAFCNRDLGILPGGWTAFSSIIATPHDLRPDAARLRFGQWQVTGSVAFDLVELVPVQALHQRTAGVELGTGERLQGEDYDFTAPWHAGTGHSRPLVRFNAGFNSDRWVMGADQEIVHRHHVPVPGGVGISAAQVTVAVVWHKAGTVLVEASADGRTWQTMGSLAMIGATTCTVPAGLLPASALWTRLRTTGAASLQVGSYTVHATLPRNPVTANGSTRYLTVTGHDARVAMVVESLGEALPGGDNVAQLRLTNRNAQALALRPTVTVTGPDGIPAAASRAITLAPGEERALRIPYPMSAAGTNTLGISLGDGVGVDAHTVVAVADLHACNYGACLPGSSPEMGLWWASSGWKISRTRPPPTVHDAALIIRAARNEAEAAQLVLRPAQVLTGLTLTAGALSGPAGATLPATAVEILRVRYVDIAQPTDAVGCVAPWPDPLPPLRGPLDLEAGRNQPFWIRVTVPRDAGAGTYTGTIALRAVGWSATVPIAVEVFGFTLPDRMTCASAFGFDPQRVWQYQRVPPAERRAVLEKYWTTFRTHHIAPYDPAPLDPFTVTWPGLGGWEGGQRDTTDRHAGGAALLLVDDKPTANVSARCTQALPLASGSLRLSFWHKAETGHRFIVSIGHQDAAGAWMRGRNHDCAITGTGAWTLHEQILTSFPPGAMTATLTLWAARWADDGATTGTVRYDDVRVQDATGRELLAGGGFESPTAEQLTPQIDWSRWDAAMTRAMEVHHFSSFRLPMVGMGGGTFFERSEPELLGFREGTPEYQAAFTGYGHAVERHLKEKGWLDRAFVYWFDEPDPKDYPFVMNGFRKLKEAAPGLRRMLTEQVEPGLVGGPDLWCPVSSAYRHDRAEERRRQDEHFWWYVCCAPKAPYCTEFIDHPGTELRTWLWQTWQRRIEGILVWETNYWTSPSAYPDAGHPQDPYADPMCWESGYGGGAGTRNPWGNGDGRFLYPPEAAMGGTGPVLDGPVDSIRWEMLRDGIEDYEYLAILRRLLDRHGSRLSTAERARCTALLEVPAAITTDATTFTRDPEPVERQRRALAEAIVGLEQNR